MCANIEATLAEIKANASCNILMDLSYQRMCPATMSPAANTYKHTSQTQKKKAQVVNLTHVLDDLILLSKFFENSKMINF